MFSCRDVARLVSESMSRKLSLKEKSSLWLHYALCGPCKDYQQCVEKVDTVCQGTQGKCQTEEQVQQFIDNRYPHDCLTPECRKRFDECIKQEMEKKKSGA